MRVGVHVLLDFEGCSVDLRWQEKIEPIIHRVVEEARLQVLSFSFHQFHPYGVTGSVMLQESHLNLHSWPEHAYLAVDIFTCGDAKKAFRAESLLREYFRPNRIRRKVIDRGFEQKACSPDRTFAEKKASKLLATS